MSSDTRLSTWRSPNETQSERTLRAGIARSGCGKPMSAAGGGAMASGDTGTEFGCAVMAGLMSEPFASQHTHCDVNDCNKQKEHQCAGPGLAVPILIRRNCIIKNLQRQRGYWIGQPM